MYSRSGQTSALTRLTPSTQTQLEAAPAAAADSNHAQIVNMIKAHLRVNLKRILVAICFLNVSRRTLADPLGVVLSWSPILVATAIPCWQQNKLRTKVDLRGRHELGELASVSDDTHRQRSETIFSTLYHLPLALILKPPARGTDKDIQQCASKCQKAPDTHNTPCGIEGTREGVARQ